MTDAVDDARRYPPEAYDDEGTLWWERRFWPGTKRRYGGERKIASWLAVNVDEGATFTMKDVRAALGDEAVPNDQEQLNRRLRRLRPDGWILPSYKSQSGLSTSEYRLERRGWHPASREPRPRQDQPSARTRRLVFERDKQTCVICGTRATESYDDLPDVKARMTLGHRIPGNRAGAAATVDDLQAECARCNETVRDEIVNPVTLPEVLPTINNLKRAERADLLKWMEQGRRSASRVDQAYADLRRLSRAEQQAAIEELRRMVGHG